MKNIIRMLLCIVTLLFIVACDKKDKLDAVNKKSSTIDEYLSTWQPSVDDLLRQEKEFSEVSTKLQKAAEHYSNNQNERTEQEMKSAANIWLAGARKMLITYIDLDKKLSIMMQYAKNSGNTKFIASNSKVSIYLKDRIPLFQSNISNIEIIYAGLANPNVVNNDNSGDYKVMPPTQKNLEILAVRLKERQKSVNFNGAELIKQIQTAIESAVKDVGGQYSFELTVGSYAHRIRTRDCNQQECFNMATFLVMTQTCAIGIGFEFQDPSILESMMRRCNGR